MIWGEADRALVLVPLEAGVCAVTRRARGDAQASAPEGRAAEEQLQVLRWIYGGLVCTQNLEFLERQAEV